MTVGQSATNMANAWLNTMRGGGNGVTFTAPAALYVGLHTGDPGASGTANVSTGQPGTRPAIGFGAAAASGANQQIAMSGTPPSFAMTATETITHMSLWSASSSGTFYWSIALTASKTVASGDTLTQNTCVLAVTPIAA